VWSRQQQYCTACAAAVILAFVVLGLYLDPSGLARLNPFRGEECAPYEQQHPLRDEKNAEDIRAGMNSRKPSDTSKTQEKTTSNPNQESDASGYYACRLAVYTRQLATFTLILAGATIVLIVIGIYQGVQLGRHARVAEQALTELERPFLFLRARNARISLPAIVDDSVRYRLVNHGRTPAILIHLVQRLAVLPLDIQGLPDQIDPSAVFDREFPGGISIGPNSSRKFSLGIYSSLGDIADLVNYASGQSRVYLIGYVRYRDIFGNHYVTGFCAILIRDTRRVLLIGDDGYNYTKEEGRRPPEPPI
jgi:hypothetical protein